MYFAPVAILVSSLLCAVPLEVHARFISTRATVCNGYSELCSKTLGNVTFVGAHDSYAVSPGSVAANQDYNVTTQLNEGIRMLQIQAHNSSGVIHLCHTSCVILDAGTLSNYLSSVKTWLDGNPNEVVVILIVNSDNLPPSQYATVYQSVGLDSLSYSPTTATTDGSQWPTLGTLIDSGKRVLTFMDSNADFASVPYIIDEFSNIWETAYDVTDQTFNCAVNRTGTAGNKMYLINHYLDTTESLFGLTFPVPDKSLLNVTNAVSGYGSLGLQASQCGAEYSKYPTVILVDFYNYGGGSVFQVAANLNSVTYVPHSVSPPVTSTTTSSSSNPTGSPQSNDAPPSVSGNPLKLGVVFAAVLCGAMLVV